MYSLFGEKSIAQTCPNGVPDVGQFEKAVKDDMWIYGSMLSEVHREVENNRTRRSWSFFV